MRKLPKSSQIVADFITNGDKIKPNYVFQSLLEHSAWNHEVVGGTANLAAPGLSRVVQRIRLRL